MSSDAATPLRIGLDAGPLHGHRTGIGVAVASLVEALERRADVRPVRYLVSRRAVPSADERKLPLPGVVASHLWSRVDRPTADRWLSDVDVVHGTNYVAPPTSLPTVVSVYDCWFLRHPDAATPVVRRAGDQLRRAIRRGAWVHASSEATADQVRGLLGTERVSTIHLGPPPLPTADATGSDEIAADTTTPSDLRAELPVLADARFVLAIGTEERRKDLSRLVRSFGLLAGRSEDLHLVLAGAVGDDSSTVSAAIDSLPVDVGRRVHRLGAIDGGTKRELLSNAAVLAYPSLDEGFGFPILEAQQHDVPVVATDVGSVAEIAGSGALLVDGPTPADLADALSAVIEDHALRRRLVDAGRANLRRFSWDRTADALTVLYRDVHARGVPTGEVHGGNR